MKDLLDTIGEAAYNLPMTRRDHSNCDHPSTKSARTACRKAITADQAIANYDALANELRLSRELSPAAYALHKAGPSTDLCEACGEEVADLAHHETYCPELQW